MSTEIAERAGMIQVYTGDGKGKTTAALGLALRAIGSGMRVYMGQFLKGHNYGELDVVRRLCPDLTLEQYGTGAWVHAGGAKAAQRAAALDGLVKIRRALVGGEYQIVIADEINMALAFGLLTEAEVLDLVACRPPEVELVLTGRHASTALIQRADLVTEMREVRHPFRRGVMGRRGIEF